MPALASKYLRLYRLQAKLTQAQLAANLGVAVSTVAKWESGKYHCPVVLIYLADMTENDFAEDGDDCEVAI